MSALSMREILLVEDDLQIQLLLKNLLTTPEQTVTACSKAEDALIILEEKKVHILVTDFNLPGMNGLDFIRHLYEKKIYLPILWITGDHSRLVNLKAWSMGVFDILLKPFEMSELEDRISKMIHFPQVSSPDDYARAFLKLLDS